MNMANMIKKNGISAMLFLAFSLACPGLSPAEEGTLTGSVTGGGAVIGMDEQGANKDKSYKFGEYSGITQNGYGIGDFDVLYENDDNYIYEFPREGPGMGKQEPGYGDRMVRRI